MYSENIGLKIICYMLNLLLHVSTINAVLEPIHVFIIASHTDHIDRFAAVLGEHAFWRYDKIKPSTCMYFAFFHALIYGLCQYNFFPNGDQDF